MKKLMLLVWRVITNIVVVGVNILRDTNNATKD